MSRRVKSQSPLSGSIILTQRHSEAELGTARRSQSPLSGSIILTEETTAERGASLGTGRNPL